MKITRASDYAIRLLIHLASTGAEGVSRELAEKIDVPFNHLAKLVQILARYGYLITKKGKGGGLKLAGDPRKINLAEVIEAVEGPLLISDCILHKESCRFSKKCKVRLCLSQVQGKISELLSASTIHDMAMAK